MLKKAIIVLLISILPIVELRGSIPVGTAYGLPFYLNYPLSVVGNLLPVPFILLFIPKILDFLARFKLFRPMVNWLRKKADKGSKKILGDEESKENTEADVSAEADVSGEAVAEPAPKTASADGVRKMTRASFIGLLLFVAIPLPATGAWTGALVASLFGLPKKKSFLTILLGVLLSGTVVTLISYGVLGFLKFLL